MMALDNGATDRQPDTHAAILGCVKRFEKLVQALRSNTHACVLHAQAHMITFVSFGSDGQLPRTIVYAAHRVGGIQEQVDKGGHFAAWEEPELFANELRAAFRSLRPAH